MDIAVKIVYAVEQPSYKVLPQILKNSWKLSKISLEALYTNQTNLGTAILKLITDHHLFLLCLNNICIVLWWNIQTELITGDPSSGGLSGN